MMMFETASSDTLNVDLPKAESTRPVFVKPEASRLSPGVAILFDRMCQGMDRMQTDDRLRQAVAARLS